jgi:ribosomal protein S18 acetylase RimI-like enzyme
VSATPHLSPRAPIEIRRATPDDAAMLASLGERCFRDTYAAQNRPEDIDAYCAATYAAERMARELADPASDMLVAEERGANVGYATLVAGARTGWGLPAPAAEIVRFYVDRPWHGRGVAQVLMRATLDRARERGARTIWLGVWEHNPRAIAFYRKAGFAEVGEQTFMLGADRQRDLVMARTLDDVHTVYG